MYHAHHYFSSSFNIVSGTSFIFLPHSILYRERHLFFLPHSIMFHHAYHLFFLPHSILYHQEHHLFFFLIQYCIMHIIYFSSLFNVVSSGTSFIFLPYSILYHAYHLFFFLIQCCIMHIIHFFNYCYFLL